MKNMNFEQSKLAEFAGGKARLWDFSPSHDRLVVKLIRADGEENFLVLSGCDELAVATFWKLKQPRVEAAEGEFFEFLDDGIRVRCQDASLHATYQRSA